MGILVPICTSVSHLREGDMAMGFVSGFVSGNCHSNGILLCRRFRSHRLLIRLSTAIPLFT